MLALLTTLLSVLLALLRVAPATQAAVQERLQRDRAALALRRLQEKNARVDAALKP